MRAFLMLIALLVGLLACQSPEEDRFNPESLEYDLFQGSEFFDYSGRAVVRELKTGELEISLKLEGAKSEKPYYLLSHFHFGAYDRPDAPLAFLLNPVDMTTLESRTVLGTLSDGRKLTFEGFKSFDGHIKVHLAPDGPDYNTILAVGNIGQNPNRKELFDRETISVCSPYGLAKPVSP
jgi:hypothetical protein